VNALVIFAKAPDIHTVKTRLKGCLTDAERLNLYVSLMENTIRLSRKIQGITPFISYTPSKGGSYFERYNLPMFSQKGSDLGERMYHALVHVISLGYQKAVIVGTDIPEIDEGIISDAFIFLDESDMVLGPAKDGGYYLIGVKEANQNVFQNIDWSTDMVFKQTLKKAEEEGLVVSLLKILSDIDRPEDLNFK